METWVAVSLTALGWLGAMLLSTLVLSRLDAKRHPLAATLRATRNLLLPLAGLVTLTVWALSVPREQVAVRVLETLLWIAAIHVGLSFVKNTALIRQEGGRYDTRFPKLLIDILRVLLVLIGAALVVKGVWGGDLGGLITAIGVSSIVLGLALQNTLDNVMAGIAVLLERPFEVGDWVQIGAITGEVIEMNWRSVRVRTRTRDLVVVPNSVIGKETLVNLSRPTAVHGEKHLIGFSYDDPPNKVKRVLMGVALATRGVLAQPAPAVRTKNYAAYSIEYEIRFFIEDFAKQQEINDEFMTKVWYAAKRANLNIPFPIQTSYEFHSELPKRADPSAAYRDALARVPVFVPLSPDELAILGHDAVREEYGRGERVVHQGEGGDSFFLIQEGTAVVSLRDDQGGEREVARLGRGEFFGEMAVLTGEPRTASVTAVDDLSVLVVHKAVFHQMLARRPALAHEMAEIVEARRQGLRAIADMRSAPADQRAAIQKGAGELVARIKRFFGL
ncbi:MAG: mechanosensitive ion channel [Planctomycetes bacterium]|nr:mechanosensitive ion channel [Planctomycetota bacterium]